MDRTPLLWLSLPPAIAERAAPLSWSRTRDSETSAETCFPLVLSRISIWSFVAYSSSSPSITIPMKASYLSFEFRGSCSIKLLITRLDFESTIMRRACPRSKGRLKYVDPLTSDDGTDSADDLSVLKRDSTKTLVLQLSIHSQYELNKDSTLKCLTPPSSRSMSTMSST